MTISLFVLMLVSLSAATGPYELKIERDSGSNNINASCRGQDTSGAIATLQRKSDGVVHVVGTDDSTYQFELTPHTEGDYYCTSPDNPSITNDTKLLLYYPVTAVETADFYVVPAGSTVTLFCGIELGLISQKLANEADSSIEYTWTRGLTTIDASLVDLEPLATTISHTKLKDGDIYRCDVKVNTFPAEHEVALLVYNMTVTGHSDKAESELKVVEIREGEQNNATFFCQFEAFVGWNPFLSVNIWWTHKDERISAFDSNDTCTQKDKKCNLKTNSTLSIQNITRDDNGPVVCHVQIRAKGPQNGAEKVIIITESGALQVIPESQPTTNESQPTTNMPTEQEEEDILPVTIFVVSMAFLGTVALLAGITCGVVLTVTCYICQNKKRRLTSV